MADTLGARTVPQEVARRIVSFVERLAYLPVLARTSRALQQAAEARLYFTVTPHPRFIKRSIRLCTTIATTPRIANLVREFSNVLNELDESRDYWKAVRAAVASLRTLDYFAFRDEYMDNGWVLEPPSSPLESLEHTGERKVALKRSVTEAKLNTGCDESVLRFLEESDIVELSVKDVAKRATLRKLAPGSLPNLEVFEGPLSVFAQLSGSPVLTHLKLKTSVESKRAASLLPVILPELRVYTELRSLCLESLNEDCVVPSLAAISLACPQLQYLAVLPLPTDHEERITFLQLLTRFNYLTHLEVDIANWDPEPTTSAHQRIFTTELRLVVPTLQCITFVKYGRHWCWRWSQKNAIVKQQQQSQVKAGSLSPPSSPEIMDAKNDHCDTVIGFVGLEGWRCKFTFRDFHEKPSTDWKEI